MKLHLSRAAGTHAFSAYGAGYVAVNGVRYERSLLVLPDRVVADWGPEAFDALAAEHLAALVGLAPEVVLLGTGASLRFPRAEIVRPLVEGRIGLEVMDVQAACRTFNILAAEGRKVAAALVLA
ncbi:MAG: Mth938-like domain-containing protein [Burkholderiales bacterium]